MGLDGMPRELHIEESMKCIDFDDFEPEMDTPEGTTIANCEYFKIDKLELTAGASVGNPNADRFSIVTVVSGQVSDTSGTSYQAGDFFILPKGADPLSIKLDTVLLQTVIPS